MPSFVSYEGVTLTAKFGFLEDIKLSPGIIFEKRSDDLFSIIPISSMVFDTLLRLK